MLVYMYILILVEEVSTMTSAMISTSLVVFVPLLGNLDYRL